MVKRIELMDTNFEPPRPIYNVPSYVLKDVLLNSHDPAMRLLNSVINQIECDTETINDETTETIIKSTELHQDILTKVLELEYKSDVDQLKDIFRQSLVIDTANIKKYASMKDMIGIVITFTLLLTGIILIKQFM